MKKLTVAFVALMFSIVSASAQSIIFQVDKNSLLLPDGQVLNLSNSFEGDFNVSIYGSTVSSLSNLTNGLSAFQSASTPEETLSELVSALNGPTFSSWSPIGISQQTAPFDAWDWRETVSDLTPGSLPVLLAVTQPLSQLTVNSFVGLVISETEVTGLGANGIGFSSGTGDARWDSAAIGSLGSGSLTLTAIPEPRFYAALFGIFAFGLVSWKRRFSRGQNNCEMN